MSQIYGAGTMLEPTHDGSDLPIGTLAETHPHMANLWVKTAQGCWYTLYRHTATRGEIKEAIRKKKVVVSPMFGNEDKPIMVISVPRPVIAYLPDWLKGDPVFIHTSRVQ
ncbi:hypothetical protein HOT31_gp095 [Microbacterium phage Hendrix]|uniref:Uncharacterized protein n=1 Tax=Microbacterium phage Hendrix TaxID=2182341 RepID=A0A2U8UUS9_9CAUD|nr:hypothetical protein HOT31_gp095 [Microbacterium phage Hendrix]AWN07766.1 hypothetical protein PBI_HENDRIX_95 [Microbacterium phage Hendrix]